MSRSSPFFANVAMPSFFTSAAAASSWVESGFDAQSTTDAPASRRVIARFAVSVVTWRHAPMRSPLNGCSFATRSRIFASTGISRPAHSMRREPASASERSATSDCDLVATVMSFSRTDSW